METNVGYSIREQLKLYFLYDFWSIKIHRILNIVSKEYCYIIHRAVSKSQIPDLIQIKSLLTRFCSNQITFRIIKNPTKSNQVKSLKSSNQISNHCNKICKYLANHLIIKPCLMFSYSSWVCCEGIKLIYISRISKICKDSANHRWS